MTTIAEELWAKGFKQGLEQARQQRRVLGMRDSTEGKVRDVVRRRCGAPSGGRLRNHQTLARARAHRRDRGERRRELMGAGLERSGRNPRPPYS